MNLERARFKEKATLLKELERLMFEYAEDLEFEKAATVRDEIKKLSEEK